VRVGQVVLVTGASRYLGGRFAELLATTTGIDRVVAVDVVPPQRQLRDVDFVRADIRNPIIAKVISQAEVDTVAHLNVIATPVSAGGRASMKEINVIGTMQLLAACQRAPGVRRLVVKSSAAVYGSSPRDPGLFTEDQAARSLPRAGFGKDSVEVEGYVRGFSRRRPDVDVTVLRFANVMGPGIQTSMTDYFTMPVLPTIAGFDARFQVVHEDDALAALRTATVQGQAGVVNVAGDGMLTLSQAARLARRPTLPVPMAAGGWVGQVVRRSRLADFSPEQIQFLAFGRGLDTTRMREVLRFEPAYTSRGAFEDFLRAGRGPAPWLMPTVIGAVEQAERWTATAALGVRGA
jgi:UDP-glucose 4-epimerase